MTVNDMLNLNAFIEFKLIAGNEGLKNEITNVNIMDNPEALDWLSYGEVLLTTGYFFKDSTSAQNNWIRQLKNIGCPALCVKAKKYLKVIPQNMINTSNEVGLPLIELPYGMSFSKIMSVIVEELSGRFDIINKRSLDIHNEFFKIALNGGGIKSISDKLSEVVGNPIIMLDNYWKVLDFSDVKQNPNPISNYINDICSQKIFRREIILDFPNDFQEIRKSITRMIFINNLNIQLQITPATVANRNYGYIIALQTVSPLTEIDFIAIENATTIFALERIRLKEIENAKLKISNNFFDDLLSGKIHAISNLKSLCDLHRISDLNKYYCMVILAEDLNFDYDSDVFFAEQRADHKINLLMKYISDLNFKSDSIISIRKNDSIVLLVGRKKEKESSTVSESKELATEIFNLVFSKSFDLKVHIGIGHTYNSVLELHKSYFEAQESLKMIRRFNKKNNISHHDDFHVYNFLENNIEYDELLKFFNRHLGKLYAYDKENNSNFLNTLEYYLNHSFNATDASKALFIHRNTFAYRIDKIKKILESDLKDAEELFKINLSFKIYHLLNLKS